MAVAEQEETYTTQEVADYLGIAEATVRRHCIRRQIKAYKVPGSRQWHIPRVERDKYRRKQAGLLEPTETEALAQLKRGDGKMVAYLRDHFKITFERMGQQMGTTKQAAYQMYNAYKAKQAP